LAVLARGGSADRLEDAALDALAGIASLAVEAAGQRSRAPAARAPVRAELFQRACLARDQIEDSPGQAVPLADLAAAACLSPFHLHRVFRSVFGETPFEMGRRRRIERAKALLARRRTPVAEVAAATGFESESAFSRSFRAVTGMSPSAYRRSLAD
jgi:AraC family transcriptional regulator